MSGIVLELFSAYIPNAVGNISRREVRQRMRYGGCVASQARWNVGDSEGEGGGG